MRREPLATLGLILSLVIGIFVGILIPRGILPWDNSWTSNLSTLTVAAPAVTTTKEQATQTESVAILNSRDNIPLLEATVQVLTALEEEDFYALSTLAHPELGVTFTPYSSVDFDLDLTLTTQQIRDGAEDETLYKWGFVDGSGSAISMTIADYFDTYVYDADYSQASQLAVDKVQISGNALENVEEAYPGCRYVELSYPSRDPQNGGMDWCSLKLVFAPGETEWHLLGIIHGEWTS